jgi:hypothetical protein
MKATNVPHEEPLTERQPHPSPHRHRVIGSAPWIGLIGAPAAWSLQELINVSLAGHACYPRDSPLAMPRFEHLSAMSAGVEAVAFVVCIVAGGIAVSVWRKTGNEKPGDANQLLGSGDGRTRFMAMAGILTSGLFAFGTALAALNLAAISPCGG